MFRSTFDGAPTGMVIAEDGLRVSRANPAMCRLLGTSEAVLQGLTLPDLWACEDGDRQSLEHLNAEESTRLLGERRLSLIGQRDVWALVSVSSVTGPVRSRDPILAQFVDVSEHHHAIHALRRSESENSALLDAIPDTMLRVGRDGGVRGFRPAAASTSSSPEGSPNLGNLAALFPDHKEPLLEQVTEVLETGRASQLDLGLTETAPDRHFSATISRIDDDDALVTLRDVTEEIQLRRQLEALITSKDELVASVSHELRNPLTAIVGLAAELDRDPGSFGPGERDELIGLIAGQSREMAELIDDLLVAARSERGQVVIAPRPVDLADEVGQVLEVWTEGTARVDLSNPAKAHADPFRVRQILRNLLSNAARYGIPPVRISVEPTTNEHVELLVQDHGPGLSADQWEAIFDPYHRAHDREIPSASVGLGLAVSRHLAEVMGGSLDYLVRDGRSTFRLRLPAVTEE
jgi:PAS domain S-box-containing protein